MHNRRVSVTFLLALVLAGLGTAMVVLPSTNGIRARDHAYAGAILQPSNGAFATFYVSPGGNDSATGNSTEPFQTIARAQEAVRALTPALGGDIIVYLRNGTYRLSSGLSFNQSDGTNGTFSVTYRSFPGETAVIDGGTEIAPSSWVVHDEAAGIWASYLGGMNFRQLYVRTSSGERHNTNDPGADPVDTSPYVGYPTPLSVSTPAHDNTTCFERRAIRARELVPENTFSIQGDGHGYKTTSGLLSNFAGWTTPFAGKVDGFPASIGSGLHYAQDIEFVYHLMWNLPRVHVYTLKENAIIMQQPAFSFARTKGGTQLGDTWPGVTQPIWVENAYALLDEPGEWYYDRFTGWLFYKPLACEPQPNATSIRFIVPSVETLVTIEGNGTSPVRNIRFEGITFKHANWVRPNVLSLGHVDLQANFLLNLDGSGNRGSERSPGTLVTTHTHGITIENCTFTKLGGAGIDFYHGTQDSSIVGCIFDDLSGTAVNVGSTMAYPPDPALIVRNNSVENNYFTNIAVEFKGGHGIWGGYVQDVKFEHNTLSGTAYTAISLGWGWSPAQTVCMNNSVSFNHITNYMMEMKDGAAIYTLSLQNNTRVEYNHIHDGAGSGLYPDEQTWMTTWRYNVVYRSGNSLQDHTLGVERNATSIRENLITNNYFDKDPIIEPKRQVTHIPNNTWNITGNPATAILAIVSSAGIEPSYQGLLQRIGTVVTRQWNGTGCASCLYWSDIPPEDQNRSLLPVAVALVIAGITGFGVAGVVVMHKQGKQSVPQATRREP